MVCELTKAAKAAQVVCCLPGDPVLSPCAGSVPKSRTCLCTEAVHRVLVVLVSSVPLVTVHVLNLYPQEVSQIALPCSLKSLTHGNGDGAHQKSCCDSPAYLLESHTVDT